MKTEQAILTLEDITKEYPGPTPTSAPLRILEGISFLMESGTSAAITGNSGCGKSTLLNIAAGLDTPTSGEVLLDGTSLLHRRDDQLSYVRNTRMGFIFQNNLLLEDFTALENVMMPALISGKKTLAVKERAMALLERVGVADRAEHRPGLLSGGERQRVAIARALMNQPALLFADEPTGSLDEDNSQIMEELLLGLVREEGCALMLVTHNNAFANKCDRVLVLQHKMLTEVM